MSSPLTTFSGLSSGVQWGDVVDKLVAAQQAREVQPITTAITQAGDRRTAWSSLQSLVYGLNDAARALRNGSVSSLSTSGGMSPTTSRTLFTATTGTGATAGSYQVEVAALARQDKVGGDAVTDTGAALGVDGTFTVNGATITVASSDSLTAVRDKINAANSGASATGVTASVISTGGTGGRLVLTATKPGASGITLSDGTNGAARSLGFLSTKSKAISSTTLAIANALGLSTYPAPASITIDGKTIVVDLAVDSLAIIAARINAAGGQASVASEANGAGTAYRLNVSGNVQAVSGNQDSADIVSALGLEAGSRSSVKQTIATGTFTTGSNGSVSSSTALTNLKINGTATGIVAGDAINIRGTRGDGSAVTIGLTVGGGDTLQTLVDRINDATSGFGAGSRPAAAELTTDGRILLRDGTGGDSRLTLSLAVAKADGTSGTLGSTSVERAGRERAVATGTDASIKVDGTTYTRSSNSISDVIPGVTLSLAQAEAGTTVDFVVSRNVSAMTDAIKKLATSYNAVVDFYEAQRGDPKAPLYGNQSLRNVVSSLNDTLRTTVSANGTYTQASIAGVSLDRAGHVQVDTAALTTAIGAQPDEIERLFGISGVGQAFVTATDSMTLYGSGVVPTQLNSIDSSVQTLKQRQATAQQRVDDQRKLLTERFSRMEQLIASFQSQGSYLTNSLKNSN